MVLLAEKNKELTHGKYSITVSKNGPYLITGGVPLLEKIINYNAKWDFCTWETGKTYSLQESFALCRCGQSKNKPFCDGTHIKVNFNGTETASRRPYHSQSVKIEGPDIVLTDAKDLCASARFCHRGGGIWSLVSTSNNPGDKRIVIEDAADCPSGRLMVYEKKIDTPIEPSFEPSIVLIEDPYITVSGPIWVRGGIPIKSFDGTPYEIRNRATLCRCGKSSNKPFCDSSHYPE
ncbi:Iron-binding zinc finger CDGSH type [uncultured archaeon]|nr:Iron-binding zinc finger CDGSH type [uncultured archaeon]